MKTIKVVAAILTLIGILFGFAACAWAEQYPATFIVERINYNNDIVAFTDFNTGEQWLWQGVEDWHPADVAAVIMDDMNTPDNIFDDAIIKAYYQFNMNDYLVYDIVWD